MAPPPGWPPAEHHDHQAVAQRDIGPAAGIDGGGQHIAGGLRQAGQRQHRQHRCDTGPGRGEQRADQIAADREDPEKGGHGQQVAKQQELVQRLPQRRRLRLPRREGGEADPADDTGQAAGQGRGDPLGQGIEPDGDRAEEQAGGHPVDLGHDEAEDLVAKSVLAEADDVGQHAAQREPRQAPRHEAEQDGASRPRTTRK